MQTLKKRASPLGLIFNLNSVLPKSKPGNDGSAMASSPQNPPNESKAPSLESERTDLPAWALTHTMLIIPADTTDRTSLNFFREIIRTSLRELFSLGIP